MNKWRKGKASFKGGGILLSQICLFWVYCFQNDPTSPFTQFKQLNCNCIPQLGIEFSIYGNGWKHKKLNRSKKKSVSWYNLTKSLVIIPPSNKNLILPENQIRIHFCSTGSMILYGNSEIVAHHRSNICNWIRSRVFTNRIFFFSFLRAEHVLSYHHITVPWPEGPLSKIYFK